MNNRYKFAFIAILSLTIGMSACKEENKTLNNPKTTQKIVSSKTKPVKKRVAKTVTTKPIVKKATNKYFLISASFKSKSNAEKMKNTLQKDGYDSQIIVASNNFYRVSYKGFSNRVEAFKELKRARTTEGREDVWLHIKH